MSAPPGDATAQEAALRRLAALASVLAALGVVAGAFGAHALKPHLDADALAIWSTAASYHQTQSMAAVLAAVTGATVAASPRFARASSQIFIAGVLLFAGSLYALAVGAPRAAGMITPLGGTCFIAGWILLAVSLLRRANATA